MNMTVVQRRKLNSTMVSLMRATEQLEGLSNEPGLCRVKITLTRLRDESLAIANKVNKVLQMDGAKEALDA